MHPPDPELVLKIQLDGIAQIAKWISYLILLGASLSITVSIIRISGSTIFKVGQLELHVSRFVYVVIALTGAHAFLTWIFCQRIDQITALGSKPTDILAWERLTGSEAFVFYNMQPRVLQTVPWPLGHAYVAQTNDTAFCFSLLLAVALIIAVTATLPPSNKAVAAEALPGKKEKIIRIIYATNYWLGRLALGCILAAANWILGSQWAIAASSLKI